MAGIVRFALFLLFVPYFAAQTEGLIRDVGQGIVYVNKGTLHRVAVGQTCFVFDADDNKVGMLTVTEATNQWAKAKIKTGEGAIEMGLLFLIHDDSLNARLAFELFRVPVEPTSWDVYQNFVSNTDGDVILSGPLTIRIPKKHGVRFPAPY